MECWICEDEAKTGEHKLKASDLKAEFGKVTQANPIYMHTAKKKNIKINSIKKSNDVKSDALICAICNNSRTSEYDKAWEAFAKYLKKRLSEKSIDTIKLEKVFPGNTKEQMLNIHLYFLKLFGCAIEEGNMPIDISVFRDSILENKPHPKVYISFGDSRGMTTGNTDIHAKEYNGHISFATWFYVTESIAANIMYSDEAQIRKGLSNAWHPSTVTKRLKLERYKT